MVILAIFFFLLLKIKNSNISHNVRSTWVSLLYEYKIGVSKPCPLKRIPSSSVKNKVWVIFRYGPLLTATRHSDFFFFVLAIVSYIQAQNQRSCFRPAHPSADFLCRECRTPGAPLQSEAGGAESPWAHRARCLGAALLPSSTPSSY